MTIRGFNYGVEFAGGSQFQVPVRSGTSLQHVREAVEETGVEVSSAQERGSGAEKKYVIRTPELKDDAKRNEITAAITEAAKVQDKDVAASEVSSSWGDSVTTKALQGLVVFLVLVAAYLWVRYERKMAWAALFALVHDLLLTAGVYSLVGFEVTPGTVVGLLTILGYSLYDTVVVFDKVDENAKGILGHNRYSYPEAANLAVNQTLMRSINTSLIALLPVASLLVIGAGVLGVGTLKDLALVLFVGMLTGAYSSLFLATPWLVDLKMIDPRYKAHAERVGNRRVALERGEVTDRKTARAARVAKAAAGQSGAAAPGAVAESAADEAPADEPVQSPRPVTAGRSGGGRQAPRKRQGGKRR
jgi:preprotein translocase subunit SecF